MGFWFAAFIGFIVMVVISVFFGESHPYATLLSPLAGGFLAGILLGEGGGEGAKVGFISGIFGALLLSVIILITGTALFGAIGAVIGALIDLVIIIFATFAFGILGLIGGGIGGLFRRK